MKNSLLILFVLFFTAFVQSISSAESGHGTTTNGLGVIIKCIRVFPNHAEFDLKVRNHLHETISISRFSLATAMRTVKLSHTNGFVWKVERPKIIEDPPQTDEDYTFLIDSASTNRITIATPPLTIDGSIISKSSLQVDRPKEVLYEVERGVGTISTTSLQFKRVLCSGNGKSRIDWRNQLQK